MLEEETDPLYKCGGSEDNCLFCAVSLPPTFTVVNGQLSRLKKERGDDNDEDEEENVRRSPSNSSLTSEHFVFDKQLQVIFILRNILRIPEWKLSRFLKKFGGQLHPEFWIKVCSTCEREVQQFYKTLKAISALRRRLTEISDLLKAHIYNTKEVEVIAGKGGGDGSTGSSTNTGIWKEIRDEVLKGFEEIPVFPDVDNYKDSKDFKENTRRSTDFRVVEPESSFPSSPENHFEQEDPDSEREDSDGENFSDSNSEFQSNSESEEEYKPKNKRKQKPKNNFKSPPLKLPKKPTPFSITKPRSSSSLSPSDPRYLSQYTTFYKPGPSRYPNLRYQCNLCSGTQQCKAKILEHLTYHQSGNGSSCSQCGMFIPTGKMKYHIAAFHIERKSHKGKPKKKVYLYFCSKCPARFRETSYLKEHLILHKTKEDCTPCKKCGWLLKNKSYRRHMTIHHNITNSAGKNKPVRRSHRVSRPRRSSSDDIKLLIYHCENCSAKYKHLEQLRLHNLLHDKEQPEPCSFCEICGWLEKNKMMRRHFLNHHEGVKEMKEAGEEENNPNTNRRIKDAEEIPVCPGDNYHEDTKENLKGIREEGIADTFGEVGSESSPPPLPANHSEPKDKEQDSDQEEEESFSDSESESESQSNSENDEEYKPNRKQKSNTNFKSSPRNTPVQKPGLPLTQTPTSEPNMASLSPSDPSYLSQHTTFHVPDPSRPRNSKLRYKCNLCPITQHSKTKIQEHLSHHQSGQGSSCSQCKMFIPTGKMKYHIAAFHIERQSHEGKPKKEYFYSCSKCPARFRDTSFLKEHLILHKTKEDCTPCKECGWLLKNKSFRRHMNTHHNITDCEFPARQNKHVLPHRQSCPPVSSSEEKKVYFYTYYCENCPAKYKEMGKLKNHNLLHDKDQPAPCSYCEICGWLEKNKLMRRHFLNHHEEKKEKEEEEGEKPTVIRTVGVPFYCDFCPMIYTNMGHLQRHFSKHHVEKFPLVLCQEENCNEKFESRQLLFLHLKNSHGKEKEDGDNFDEVEEEQKCAYCDGLFKSKMKMDFHIAKKHRDVLLTCKTCNIKHNNYQNYRDHMETTKAHSTSKSFFCELCGKAYWDKDRLKVHRRQEHFQELGLVPISCPECGKILSDKKTLESHIKLVHKKERNYSCEFCGRTFALQHNLENHSYAFHQGSLANPVVPEGRHFRLEKNGEGDDSKEEKWLCDFCPVIFPNLQQVRTHLLSQHYDQLKHCCEGCGKRYCASMGLHKHRKTCSALKIPEEDDGEKEKKIEEQFSCEFCSKTFNRREAIYRHRRRVHKDRYSHKCKGCGNVYKSLANLISHRIDCCEDDPKGKDLDAQLAAGNAE